MVTRAKLPSSPLKSAAGSASVQMSAITVNLAWYGEPAAEEPCDIGTQSEQPPLTAGMIYEGCWRGGAPAKRPGSRACDMPCQDANDAHRDVTGTGPRNTATDTSWSHQLAASASAEASEASEALASQSNRTHYGGYGKHLSTTPEPWTRLDGHNYTGQRVVKIYD